MQRGSSGTTWQSLVRLLFALTLALATGRGQAAQTVSGIFPLPGVNVPNNDVLNDYSGWAPCCPNVAIDSANSRAYSLVTPLGSNRVLDLIVTDLGGTILNTVPLPSVESGSTNSVLLNHGNGKIYVLAESFSNSAISEIDIVDAASYQVTRIELPLYAAAMAINSSTNKIYVLSAVSNVMMLMDGATNQVTQVPLPQLSADFAVAVNSVTNKIYISARGIPPVGIGSAVLVMDGLTNQLTEVPLPANISPVKGIGVNTVTNTVYMFDEDTHLVAMDGSTNQFSVFTSPVIGGPPFGLAVDSGTNRVYLPTIAQGTLTAVFFGDSNKINSFPIPVGATGGIDLDTQTHRLFLAALTGEPCGIQAACTVAVDPGNSTTATGPGVTVQADELQLTFDSVAMAGSTSVTPIDPGTVGQVPGGFAVSGSQAYEVSTTASFSGPVTIAFPVSGPISQQDFNSLRILHNQNGTLVDVTATSPPPDYSTLTIYAITPSFSPFYLVRTGYHFASLFDQAGAYKAGRTVPIQLQILDSNGLNVSSPSLIVSARSLLKLDDSSSSAVIDSGNANPDSNFRFDSTIGTTGGYIFNLSTKPLTAGTYALSFYVGGDKTFFYTLTFQVR